jgi:hypothetical protein
MNNLNNLLVNYINDPSNPENNFSLAQYYHAIGQTASAVSYYIRTAERAHDDLLKYECLLLAAKCFEAQGTRAFSVKGMLMHAVSLLPKRPEAYYAMSKFYEFEKADGNWFRCYMMASIGLEVSDFNAQSLRTNIDFPGKYALLFQKGLSAWWCGLCEDSRNIFKDLLEHYDLDDNHRRVILLNLEKLGGTTTTPGLTLYNRSKHEHLRYKFLDSNLIEKNFAESYQDMFVLTMLNGKKNGTYLEIGAGNSFYGSNTALLEQKYNWTGIALDLDERFVEAHQKERKNPCLLRDATTINYEKFLSGLNFNTTIDYLQIDCDPPSVSYQILLQIPFEKYKFAVITFEHDYYCDESKSFREKSRNYLESYGYVLVAGDIAPDEWRNYEDWWVHPDLVSPEIIQLMKNISEKTKKAENYMLGKD